MKYVFTFLFLVVLDISKSNAQISWIADMSVSRFTNQKFQFRPDHIGIGTGLSADFLDKNRITAHTFFYYPVVVDETDHLRIANAGLARYVPSLFTDKTALKIFEI